MIKTIIFDAGGVLFKNNWAAINKAMIRKFGFSTLVRSMGFGKLYDKTRIGKKDVASVFRAISPKIKNMQEVKAFYKKVYWKHNKINKLLLKLIKKLHKRYKLACLTDTNKLHFGANSKHGMFKDFDYVFASYALGSTKSNKKTFRKVLSLLRTRPEETIFIDDNPRNIALASSLRIKTIRYRNYAQLRKELGSFKE